MWKNIPFGDFCLADFWQNFWKKIYRSELTLNCRSSHFWIQFTLTTDWMVVVTNIQIYACYVCNMFQVSYRVLSHSLPLQNCTAFDICWVVRLSLCRSPTVCHNSRVFYNKTHKCVCLFKKIACLLLNCLLREQQKLEK